MSLKSMLLLLLFCILFNNLYQSHDNDNKKFKNLVYPIIYNDIFRYCYF